MCWRLISFSLFVVGILLPLDIYAGQHEAKDKVRYNLNQCISVALKFSPELGESVHEEDIYKAKKMQADSAIYPQIEILGLMGPAPEAKREDFLRTDVSSKINGAFGSLDLTLIQPIYTYGKISGYREAASSGLKVASAGTLKKKSDIILRTKELYYGLLFARDLKNLVLEIKDELTRSIEKTEKQLRVGSPWADEVNIYKFRAFLGEAEKNLNEIDKNIVFLREALMAYMGLSEGDRFEIADNALTPEEKLPDTLVAYLNNAKQLRQEFIQIEEGLNAKKALVDIERSNYYPQIFLGLKASVSGATNRDKIKNPYISGQLNRSYGALFAGAKWSVDFGLTKGRVSEAEAEYAKLKEKKRFAVEAVPLQVKKAYFDFEEARKNIHELENAFINAKKWLTSAVANYDLGVGEATDVSDAASVYALTKTNYLKSILNHRLSYANLLNASGLDIKERN